MSTHPARDEYAIPLKMDTRILVISENPAPGDLPLEALQALGCEPHLADSGNQVLMLLKTSQFDAILADAPTTGQYSMEVLQTIRRDYPEIDIVMVAAPEDLLGAERARNLGACDCLTKPVKIQDLKRLFERLEQRRGAATESSSQPMQNRVGEGSGGLIGTSERMQKVYRLVSKVAVKRHPVLILGESGTGKELVARDVHAHSPWRDKPFVPVDCGALTPTLIESELFGHVRGAFTGATQSRQGLLAAAGGGTVFLDEIGELPVELQSKLLRALQEREIKPLGSNDRMHLEARVIAATNQDLETAVKNGTFRKDLYFRLNVVCIKLPPLRERRGDIPALVRHFVERYGGEGNSLGGVSDEVLARLMSYDWPGNVRELENCIQRALALGTGPQIHMKDLPSNLLYVSANMPSPPKQVMTNLQQLKQKAILQALEVTGGDRLRAAKLLGIGKTTLYRKLKEYGLEDTVDLPPVA